MLNKTPLLHQSSGPHVFLSLSFSLSLSGYFFGTQRPSEFTFLPRLLRPSREGALRLHPIERAPEASVNRASPVEGALLAFSVNQGISASFSPLLSYPPLQTTMFRSIKGPQQCPTLCDPTDSSPPGSPIPGILQARTLEWFAISFSNA